MRVAPIPARGASCSYRKDCFKFARKEKIYGADIIICNHYFLACDLKVKTEKEKFDSAVLPKFEYLVIDEAHHFDKVFLDMFKKSFSRKRVTNVLAQFIGKTGAFSEIEACSDSLILATDGEDRYDFNDLYAIISTLKGRVREKIEDIEDVYKKIHSFLSKYYRVYDIADIKVTPELFKDNQVLIHCLHPVVALHKDLTFLIKDVTENLYDRIEKTQEEEKAVAALSNLGNYISNVNESLSSLYDFLYSTDPYSVKWLTVDRTNVLFNTSPLFISDKLAATVYPNVSSVIYLSATLAVNNKFDYSEFRLGLDKLEPEERLSYVAGSPFDFEHNAQLQLPSVVSKPTDKNFITEIAPMIQEFCMQLQGRTFVLFTSYKNLNECYNMINKPLREAGLTVLSQTDRQYKKERLPELFKSQAKSVLFGTSTFWEGVDVPGDKLQHVIIDKLPFPNVGDPLIDARCKYIDASKGNAFMSYTVPEAIIKLKQGVGRLIRTKTDRGVITILDNRVSTSRYGSLFVKSLPPMPAVHGQFLQVMSAFKRFFKLGESHENISPILDTDTPF